MAEHVIAVMGATGNTGRKIAETLLRAGHSVRALGRSQARLANLERAGAEVLTGDVADAAFLAQAFCGANAVYTLLATDQRSPDYAARQRQQGEAIVQAIRESGVRYIVALSSLGADLAGGTGILLGLHEQEERLRRLEGTNVLILRPVSFYENFYGQLALIKEQGVMADSVAPDLVAPMIAARDVADVASRALAARDWHGVVVRELLGQRNLTHREVARILGERIGKPDLQYVQLTYDEMAESLVQAGMSPSFARLYVEMTRAFNGGTVGPGTTRTAENTTPTPFEAFADELARAYHAA